MTQPQRTLGIRLKEARRRRRLSQEDVAEIVGIHPVSVSKYERDAQDPNTTTLGALADAYGVSTDWLINEHEDFIHHGLKSHEKVMKLVISLPSVTLRIRKDALSETAIEDITEFLLFTQQRDGKRRGVKGA